MNEDDFSVIIVTFNSEADILGLLTDIDSIDPEILPRTIVIDNHSSDTTVALIQANYAQIVLIPNEINIGYGAAINQAAGMVQTNYFFLLNPDICLTPHFFSGLTEVMKYKDVAAAGPLQYKIEGCKKFLNFCWSFWKIDCFKIYLEKNLFPWKSYSQPIRVDFLNAGCLMIKKSAFDAVGGFNQRYFLYGEEPDLFLKFKLHGYLCYLHPGVEVIHYRDHSIKQLSGLARAGLKLAAVRNISDAMIRGYWRIFRDRVLRANSAELIRPQD